MADSIKPTLTLAALDAEAKPEPFIFGIGGKLITFPDPMELSFEESDSLLRELRTARDATSFLKKWLPEEDFEVFRAAKPTGRQVQSLLEHLLEHYELTMGDAGEERTSGTA